MKIIKSKTRLRNLLFLLVFLFLSTFFLSANYNLGQNVKLCSSSSQCVISTIKLSAQYQCGNGSGNVVTTSINFGCYGTSCTNGNTNNYCNSPHNPIIDLIFAIIRFLSDGVGLVIIASIIVGGIQYIGARGDPNNTGMAVKRLTSSVIALIIFIFAYAILDYVIPGAFFK